MTTNTKEESIEEVWKTLCTGLQEFGAGALKEPRAIDRAEGVRHALRYMSHLADHYIEFADAAFPEFRKVATPTRKLYGDCVDADYFSATIDPAYTYRIRGERHGSPHTSVIVYRKELSRRIAGNLSDEELGDSADGKFDIWLSRTPQPGPGILLDDRCNEVVLRKYFNERASQDGGSIEIERVGSEGAVRGELQEDWILKSLKTCARAMEVAPARLHGYRKALQSTVNTLVDSKESGMSEMFFGTSANKYLAGWYRLEKGQSLHIELPRMDAKYVGINIYNLWMESLEFRDRTVSLNDAQMVYGDDGVAHIYIGGPKRESNWIDTCGHDEGSILVRFLETDSELPSVKCELVNS